MGKTPTTTETPKLDKDGVAAAKAAQAEIHAAVAAEAPAEGEVLDPNTERGVQDDAEQGLALLQQHKTLSLVGGVSTDDLRQALEVQTEQRALIKAFIQHHLAEGTDYGQIHVVKSCPDETKRRGSCTKSYHLSKRVLFKPGQEKIFSLFSITDTLEKDTEAYEMLGNSPGLVAYKCTLYRAGNEKPVGHGRGAASVGEQGRNANSTIKIAEKRARMDACLSLGFSEYFTQDLDDDDYKKQAQQANERAAAEAEARDKDDLGLWIREPHLALDTEERTKLFTMIKNVGYKDPDTMLDLLKANGIADAKTMTSGQARDFMRKVRDGAYTPVAVRAQAEEPPVDDTPPTSPAATTAPTYGPVQEHELVVDDDLKAHVMERYESIGLNARGRMWFNKNVWGKPFAGFDKFTDKQWRDAYNFIEDILDMRVEVPDQYVAGVVTDDTPPPTTDYSLPTTPPPGHDIDDVPDGPTL